MAVLPARGTPEQAGLEHSKNQGRCEKVQGQGIRVLPQLGFPFWLLLLREVSLAQAGPEFLIILLPPPMC